MKKFLLLTAVAALAATAGAQTNVPSVTAAEYFIGTDPGAGLATPIPLATSNSIVGVTEEVNVNVSGLEAGTHTVGVRFQDATGQWGNPVYQRFTVYPSDYQGQIPGPEGPAATLSAAEYFIGVDPGAGNGTPLTLAEAGRITSQTTELPINISSLAPGTYSVGVRFQSADGVWGNPVYQRFTIYPDNYELATPAAPADSNSLRVTAAEYFVGSDPGAGNGTSIPIATAALVGTFENIDVPIASLGQGTYRVGVRFKSADGTWGNPVYTGFTVYDFDIPINRAPSAIYLTSSSFREGIPTGTVISALSTVDPDGDPTFTYELVPGAGADNNGVFTLEGSLLKTALPVDFTILTRDTLSIRVRTTDPSGSSYEENFSIQVLPVLTANHDSVLRDGQGGSVTTIAKSQLLANDRNGNLAGISFALPSGTTAAGGSVTISGGWILYTSPAGLAAAAGDSFNYRISDSTGNLSEATVSLTSAPMSASSISVARVENGTAAGTGVTSYFNVIPNKTYRVLATGSLAAPIQWVNLGNFTSTAVGELVVPDPTSGSSRFYKMEVP
jgi:hypothetical protein